MAQIDLRLADVYLKDGFAAVGAVNMPATITGAVNQPVTPPADGDTTVTVDGFSRAIPNGSTINFTGTTGTFTVVSTVGGSTPTSITFTPAVHTADTLPVDNTVVTAHLPVPVNGGTSVTVDGFTSAIPVGNTLTFTGTNATYTVVSTVGGSTPTSITFTPALTTGAGIPVDNTVVTVGPNVLKVKIGEGTLTYSEKRAMEYVRNKRSIAAGFVRSGDDQPMEVKFQFVWEFLSSDSGDPPTIEEALNKAGAASAWVTSGADPCEPYCVDVEVVYTPPCSGVKGEVIALKEFRWESGDHDMKAGTVDVSGKCKLLLATKSRKTTPITP